MFEVFANHSQNSVINTAAMRQVQLDKSCEGRQEKVEFVGWDFTIGKHQLSQILQFHTSDYVRWL